MLPQPESIFAGDQVLIPRGTVMREAELSGLRSLAGRPWADGRIALMSRVSEDLLRHPELRREPAAVALGFWLRRANLLELQRSFAARRGEVRVPAGLVFHVTPANVDTMFVYSWALSFLAGNANVVRLTTRLGTLMKSLIDVLAHALEHDTEYSRADWFVSYEHDDRVTAALSLACDLRVVWGGDETVKRLRGVPLNPHAAERSFASKRSFSVFRTEAFLGLPAAERRRLAELMTGDIIPFGQMACSSPHEVVWIGAPAEASEAAKAFHELLDRSMSERTAPDDIAGAVKRMNAGFATAASGVAVTARFGGASAALSVRFPGIAENDEPCGSGLLKHSHLPSLGDLPDLVRAHHQTVTHFGFAPEELREFAEAVGRRGVDRVVPVGQALAFAPDWDGFDLWSDLTRVVTVR